MTLVLALSVLGAPAFRVTMEPDVAAAAGSDSWTKLSRSSPDTVVSFTASFTHGDEVCLHSPSPPSSFIP